MNSTQYSPVAVSHSSCMPLTVLSNDAVGFWPPSEKSTSWKSAQPSCAQMRISITSTAVMRQMSGSAACAAVEKSSSPGTRLASRKSRTSRSARKSRSMLLAPLSAPQLVPERNRPESTIDAAQQKAAMLSCWSAAKPSAPYAASLTATSSTYSAVKPTSECARVRASAAGSDSCCVQSSTAFAERMSVTAASKRALCATRHTRWRAGSPAGGAGRAFSGRTARSSFSNCDQRRSSVVCSWPLLTGWQLCRRMYVS